MIKFSLLMSVYIKDDPAAFKQALESVAQSSIVPTEVVLVCDGVIKAEHETIISTFDKFINIKLVRLPVNKGLGRALREGISHCLYNWIARFDSDDVCSKDRFEKQIDFITSNEDIDIVGSWIKEFQNNIDTDFTYRKPPCSHTEIIHYAKKRNPFNHMTVFYRKDRVLEAGSYQDDHLYEDYALWVRMILAGAKCANIPEFLVSARVDGMVKRRGGSSYAVSELKSQWRFYKLGFLNIFQFCSNLLVRLPVRFMPNWLRSVFYRLYLR